MQSDELAAPELLPCPFCGGEALTHHIRDGRQAYCRVCHACGPTVFHGPLGVKATEELAIAAWNRRATPAALAASPEGQAMIREAEARGMERAAKLVDKRAEEYDREFGIYDYTTGVTEYPGTGDESMEEWESISTAIRAEAAALKGETT